MLRWSPLLFSTTNNKLNVSTIAHLDISSMVYEENLFSMLQKQVYVLWKEYRNRSNNGRLDKRAFELRKECKEM